MERNRAEGGECQTGMFPDAARKRPPSLYTSAMLATAKLVTQFVKSGQADWKQVLFLCLLRFKFHSHILQLFGVSYYHYQLVKYYICSVSV